MTVSGSLPFAHHTVAYTGMSVLTPLRAREEARQQPNLPSMVWSARSSILAANGAAPESWMFIVSDPLPANLEPRMLRSGKIVMF